jgi:hypothetical protein
MYCLSSKNKRLGEFPIHLLIKYSLLKQCFDLFLFYFHIHPLILSILGIGLHIWFDFVFFKVILISWPKLLVLQVNPSLIEFFFCLFNWFFFNFIFQHWVHWELRFIIYLNLLSTWLTWSYDLSPEFNGLTWAFLYLFLIDFFSFLSFNIGFDYGLSFIIYFNLFSMRLS